MRTRAGLGVVLAGMSLCALSAAGDDGWSLDKEGDGVKIFTRKEPGWGLKAYRATMKVKAPLAAVVAIVADADAFPDWYTDCSENHIIKRMGTKEYVTYFVNDSPFPVMDRDSIIHTVVGQNPETKVVRFELTGKPDFMPEKSDKVRVPRLQGYWMMTPLSDTETEVTQEIRTDTGGSVPAFLANQQVTTAPYKSFLKMRRVLEKPKYKNAQVNFETAEVTFGK